MYTEINKEIFELKEKLRVKAKLDSLKNMVNEELKKKKAQEILLGDKLQEEKSDVDKLDGTSVSSIILSLIGKKEEKLDKEREEYLAAKIRYEECQEAIKELKSELDYANRELENYSGVKEEYDRLIKEKEELLLKDGSEKGKDLRFSQDKINELELDIKEVKEAINAGKKANRALNNMKVQLDKARGWGMWDMMGGGLISNIAKHSAIDEANKIAQSSQHMLRSFEKELSDVNEFTDVKVNLTAFSTFADFFFDGFFVDWFVQSKINDTLRNVENTYRKTSSIIADLETNLGIIESKLNDTEAEIKNILEL